MIRFYEPRVRLYQIGEVVVIVSPQFFEGSIVFI